MTEIADVGKWVEYLELLYIAGGNMKYYSNLGHTYGSLHKVNHISTETLM